MIDPHDDGHGMTVTRVEALGFRSLRYVSQRLGSFHVLVGPNASGKSTFLDVLAFLGDLQRVGLVQAVTGYGPYGVPLRATDPQHLTWMRRGKVFELAVEATIPADLRERLRERVGQGMPLRDQGGCIRPATDCSGDLLAEAGKKPPMPSACEASFRIHLTRPRGSSLNPNNGLLPTGRRVVSRGRDPERVVFRAETSRRPFTFHLQTNKPALANLPEDEETFPVATRFRKMLDVGIQRIAPWSEAMHRPGSPAPSNAYFPDGSNLPQVVQSVEIERPDRYADWIGHVREALPDIDRITVTKRPEDGHSYLVVHYHNGLKAPSWLVSDGTLRFLALTLLAYLPNPTGALTWSRSPRTGSILDPSRRSLNRSRPSTMPRCCWRPIPRSSLVSPASIKCCVSPGTTKRGWILSGDTLTRALGIGRESLIWVCCSRAGSWGD